jgi:hypothetical protein
MVLGQGVGTVIGLVRQIFTAMSEVPIHVDLTPTWKGESA